MPNPPSEKFIAHVDKLEKQRTCGNCGADRNQMMRMHMHEQGIVQYLREQRVVKRDSCIQCVQKHVGKALVLYQELLTATNENNVNVPLNHLEVIGNLQAAADEAEEWPELHDTLDAAEREYRYKGVGPDWERLAKMIAEVSGGEASGDYRSEA